MFHQSHDITCNPNSLTKTRDCHNLAYYHGEICCQLSEDFVDKLPSNTEQGINRTAVITVHAKLLESIVFPLISIV